MTNNSKKLMAHKLFIPLVVLLVGLVLAFFGVFGQITASKLQQNGVVVNSLDIEGNTEVIKNGSHSIREIAPKFTTKQGNVHTCRAKVDENMLRQLSQNPIVQVRYLPSKPTVCEIKGAQSNTNNTPLILGGLMILGAIIALIKSIKK